MEPGWTKVVTRYKNGKNGLTMRSQTVYTVYIRPSSVNDIHATGDPEPGTKGRTDVRPCP